MNNCAAGPSDQFFNVTMAGGSGGTGSLTASAFRSALRRSSKSENPVMIVTKRCVASNRVRKAYDAVSTAGRGGSAPDARNRSACKLRALAIMGGTKVIKDAEIKID